MTKNEFLNLLEDSKNKAFFKDNFESGSWESPCTGAFFYLRDTVKLKAFSARVIAIYLSYIYRGIDYFSLQHRYGDEDFDVVLDNGLVLTGTGVTLSQLKDRKRYQVNGIDFLYEPVQKEIISHLEDFLPT